MSSAKRMLPLLAALLLYLAPAPASAGLFVSITVAPPLLPVYAQPVIPGPGYIWAPGYWAWDDDVGDYYWVPGAWVLAPRPGVLWTPGYWGWDNGVYLWHAGYWGPTVGFYGGVAYGFGYTGVGYGGGYWSGGSFYYNRSCNNINTTVIQNTYNKTIIVNNTITKVSFNGGPNGTSAKPTPDQIAAAKAAVPPTNQQVLHQDMARKNPDLRASINKGKPKIMAVSKPGGFDGKGAIATGAPGSLKPLSGGGKPPSGGKPSGAAGFDKKVNVNPNFRQDKRTLDDKKRFSGPNQGPGGGRPKGASLNKPPVHFPNGRPAPRVQAKKPPAQGNGRP